ILAPMPDFRAGPRFNRHSRNRRRLTAMIHVTERRLVAVVIACVLALAVPAAVLGHAELKTATPAAGSVQTKPVTEVSGVYTDSMKKDGSSIELLDSSGAEVAGGGVDPADDTRMVVTLDAPLVAGA